MTSSNEDGSSPPERHLRLLFTEDLKSAIANVDTLHGYLLHTVGLKLYAKAFEQDERLLAVAFLDAGAHTTCIRALKNLLLIGDALRGLNFIAFQVCRWPDLVLKHISEVHTFAGGSLQTGLIGQRSVPIRSRHRRHSRFRKSQRLRFDRHERHNQVVRVRSTA